MREDGKNSYNIIMEERRVIVALIIVTLTTSAFIAGFLLFGGTSEQTAPLSEQSNLGGNLAERFSETSGTSSQDVIETSSHIRSLSDGQAVSAVSSSDGSILYYERGTGKVFRVNPKTGEFTLFSASILPHFLSTAWSKDRKEVISTFQEGSVVRLRYFNYTTKQNSPLEANARAAAFSPDGSLIAYFRSLDGEKGEIVLAQPGGSSPKRILATRIGDPELTWIDQKRLALYDPDDGTGLAHLLTLSVDGDLTEATESQLDMEALWSPDGSQLLLSFFNGDNDLGLYVQRAGEDPEPLGLSGYASHCTWTLDSKTVFCGIPQSPILFGKTGSKMMVPESIYRITIADKTSRAVFAPKKGDMRIGVGSPFLSSLENMLIFINGFDGKLYRITL